MIGSKPALEFCFHVAEFEIVRARFCICRLRLLLCIARISICIGRRGSSGIRIRGLDAATTRSCAGQQHGRVARLHWPPLLKYPLITRYLCNNSVVSHLQREAKATCRPAAEADLQQNCHMTARVRRSGAPQLSFHPPPHATMCADSLVPAPPRFAVSFSLATHVMLSGSPIRGPCARRRLPPTHGPPEPGVGSTAIGR